MSSFVSAQKTQVHRTAPTFGVEPILRPQRNVELVLATVMENFFLSLGAFGVVIAVGLIGHTSEWWKWGDVWNTIILIGGSMFLFVFGFWSIRFGLDDIREVRLRLALENQCAELLESNERLQNELTFLRSQNRNLSTQNAVIAQQKSAPKLVKPTNELIAAKRAARILIDRWTQGIPYGRDHAGLPQPEWYAARDLLVRAGAMANRGGKVGFVFVAESESHASEALSKQVELEAQAAEKHIVVG